MLFFGQQLQMGRWPIEPHRTNFPYLASLISYLQSLSPPWDPLEASNRLSQASDRLLEASCRPLRSETGFQRLQRGSQWLQTGSQKFQTGSLRPQTGSLRPQTGSLRSQTGNQSLKTGSPLQRPLRSFKQALWGHMETSHRLLEASNRLSDKLLNKLSDRLSDRFSVGHLPLWDHCPINNKHHKHYNH